MELVVCVCEGVTVSEGVGGWEGVAVLVIVRVMVPERVWLLVPEVEGVFVGV